MAEQMHAAATAGESRPEEEAETAASAVLDDLESLRGRVKVAEQQRDEYLNLVRRTRADFENYQKRSQRDLAEERRHIHADLVQELLPALDNLQRTLDAARQEEEKGPLVQGVALVLAQLLAGLGRFGVTRIEALGKAFDPHEHEAVRQQPRTDTGPGSVVEVVQPGYRLHDRVLRPAKVVVAAPLSSDDG